MSELAPYAQRLLKVIGLARRELIWELLCDNFPKAFKSKEAAKLIETELSLSPKTSRDYLAALVQFWLQAGNSDLIQLRSGLYSWDTEKFCHNQKEQ